MAFKAGSAYVGLNHPQPVAGLALPAPVTHRPERVPPFDGMALAAVAPPHRVDLGNSAVDRELRAGDAEAGRSAAGPAAISLWRAADYKDLTVPAGILYGAGDRILDTAVHGKGLAAEASRSRAD